METSQNIWGLSQETIDELGDELLSFHQEFAPLFTTTTRDVSEHAFTELKGSLLMDGKRTYTGVARKIVDQLNDGQNLQHFMSDSPCADYDDVTLIVLKQQYILMSNERILH